MPSAPAPLQGLNPHPVALRATQPLPPLRERRAHARAYSTVTDFARLRGWSTSLPMKTAVW
jgi:hypothetical protein